MRRLATMFPLAIFVLPVAAVSAQADFRAHRDAARACAQARLAVMDLVSNKNHLLWSLGSDSATDAPLQQSMVTDVHNWVTNILVRDMDFVWTEMQADRYLTTDMCRAFLFDFGSETLSLIDYVIEHEELPYRLDWENARSKFIEGWWYRSEALDVPVAGETRPASANPPIPPAWRTRLGQ